MIVLDSCVWIAYLNESDSQHKKALDIVTLASTPILLSEYVVLEVYTVLAHRVSARVARAFLEIVSHNQDIKIILTSEEFFRKTTHICLEEGTDKLSFADCSLLAFLPEYQVITFDRALQKAIRLQAWFQEFNATSLLKTSWGL